MSKNKITARHIVPALQFGGLGLLIYGVTQGNVIAGIFGIAAALIGGAMWKMKRQDAEHESRTK